MKLPVIVEGNFWTLPQERYNTQWLKELGVGTVLNTFNHVESAVKDLFEEDNLRKIQARLAGMDNRAIFEIPPVLESILSECRRGPGTDYRPRG